MEENNKRGEPEKADTGIGEEDHVSYSQLMGKPRINLQSEVNNTCLYQKSLLKNETNLIYWVRK